MKFYESDLEQAIVEMLAQQGFQHSHGSEIPRQEKDVLLYDDLQAYFAKRYASEQLSDSEIRKIIAQLDNLSATPLYDGSKNAFWLINQGITLSRENHRPAVHIHFIDFDCVENNHFRVVNQFNVQGESERIPDILLFINGIPVSIFELKTATDEQITIFDAWEQIHLRYRRDIPKLLKTTFLSVISDGANTKLGTVFTPYHFYYAWNRIDEQTPHKTGIGSLESLIKGAFTPERLLALLRDFIYYPDNSDSESVIVSRYPQFFAANKIFTNIQTHLKPQGDGKGGTYFGATGCGKTYTMLYLSRLLVRREQGIFKNPTVIIITDREDLDSQAAKIFTNAKTYLGEDEVLSIESRQDLANRLRAKPSGGVYLTTIQKFAEHIGLLSDRTNIICISDEAHRSQTGVDGKLVLDEKEGAKIKYGFARYLRDSFPNATYVGFTGTPIDETLNVFGGVVDKYTMKQASDDGITVRIAYEPRLARVMLSDDKAKEIQRYYDSCAEQGSTEYEIERSKREMSQMRQILAHPDRLALLAADMVNHYETLCAENPNVLKKAMIVCADRGIAFDLLQQILAIRPEWGVPKKAEDESQLDAKALAKLTALEKIKLVATRNENDPKALYDACGTKEYRKELDRQFKNEKSNFKIAVVVDMWITGFDVPSLAVMYIDKPLQKHTLIQTISRVNRNFNGKTQGIVVDYIGIKDKMLAAVKTYGDDESPVDNIDASLKILRDLLTQIDQLMQNFDATDFYNGTALARLYCLNLAAEWVQQKAETEKQYMGLSKRLKYAYEICIATGELSDDETAKCQFYLAVRSIVFKQHRGNQEAPDTEQMNAYVSQMVQQAISTTGVESIIDSDVRQELFTDEFERELDNIKLPVTKFNALLTLLKKAINDYGKINKVKSLAFDERMRKLVEKYNNRDNLVFANEVAGDVVNRISDEILDLIKELQQDRQSFENLGVSVDEKAYYDILISVRDKHQFDYADEKCLALAPQIKALVDKTTKIPNWSQRYEITSELNMEIIGLLYTNKYPPEWGDEVFELVVAQVSE